MPGEVNAAMKWWRDYWFAPSPYLDLAVVRIVAVAVWLWWVFGRLPHLATLAALPEFPLWTATHPQYSQPTIRLGFPPRF